MSGGCWIGLMLGLGRTGWAATPPEASPPPAERREEVATCGTVVAVDVQAGRLVLRELTGGLAAFELGPPPLGDGVEAGATVRLWHDRGATLARRAEPVELLREAGVVARWDPAERILTLRQPGGDLVTFEVDPERFDPALTPAGRRVEVVHVAGERDALAVLPADRPLEDAPDPQPQGRAAGGAFPAG